MSLCATSIAWSHWTILAAVHTLCPCRFHFRHRLPLFESYTYTHTHSFSSSASRSNIFFRLFRIARNSQIKIKLLCFGFRMMTLFVRLMAHFLYWWSFLMSFPSWIALERCQHKIDIFFVILQMFSSVDVITTILVTVAFFSLILQFDFLHLSISFNLLLFNCWMPLFLTLQQWCTWRVPKENDFFFCSRDYLFYVEKDTGKHTGRECERHETHVLVMTEKKKLSNKSMANIFQERLYVIMKDFQMQKEYQTH